MIHWGKSQNLSEEKQYYTVITRKFSLILQYTQIFQKSPSISIQPSIKFYMLIVRSRILWKFHDNDPNTTIFTYRFWCILLSKGNILGTNCLLFKYTFHLHCAQLHSTAFECLCSTYTCIIHFILYHTFCTNFVLKYNCKFRYFLLNFLCFF
jgi:hypothetical protein